MYLGFQFNEKMRRQQHAMVDDDGDDDDDDVCIQKYFEYSERKI